MKANDHRLEVQTGVNPQLVPFVLLILDKKVIGQVTPDEVREFARSLIEAAEAAETDAFQLLTEQATA
jgi:hypothetical protein